MGSVGRWIRLYEHVLNHPKVQHLDGETFKVWINLLCLTSQCGGNLPPNKHIAWALRLSESGVAVFIEKLISVRLVDATAQGLAIHDWHDWQYFGSETSTERVRRHRQNKKQAAETLRVAVSETFQRSAETDRETEEKTRVEKETTYTKERCGNPNTVKHECDDLSMSAHEPTDDDGTLADATRIDPNWQPGVADVAAAISYGLAKSDLQELCRAFVDHYLARYGEWGLSHDWSAMWRKWCRHAARRQNAKPPGKIASEKTIPDRFFVARDSADWPLWEQHWRKTKGVGPPTTTRDNVLGWYFPSQQPPTVAV